MTVKPARRKDPKLSIAVSSSAEALELAKQVAVKLDAYEIRKPRIREKGFTFTLDASDGIVICGRYYATARPSLEGAARLIAKGLALAASSEAAGRATIQQFASDVAEVVLSGDVLPRDYAELLKAMTAKKDQELTSMFDFIGELPPGTSIQIWMNLPSNWYCISIGPNTRFVSPSRKTARDQYLFLRDFELIKQQVLRIRNIFAVKPAKSESERR